MPRTPRQIETTGRIEPPVRRRQVLVALAVAPVGLAAACTGGASVAAAPTGAPSTPAPADPLVAHLVAEQRFLASYQATIARHPSLANRLGPLRDDHAAHVAAMQRQLGVTPPSTAAPGASGTPAASPTPDPTALAAVPGTPDAAIRKLRKAEHDAAVDRAAGCLIASAAAAPLLASIAACEASHEAVLT